MDGIMRHSPPVGPLGPDVYKAWGFHQSVRWRGLVHYAGIAPLAGDDPASVECVGMGDMGAQIAHILISLDAFLQADGLDRSHVLSWTLYVTDVAEFLAVVHLLAEWAGEHLPAATLVQVSALAHPDQRVEITVMAADTDHPPGF